MPSSGLLSSVARDLREVGHGGTGVEHLQGVVGAVLASRLASTARLCCLDVAEGDRVGGQVCWQAVTTSPSAIVPPSSLAGCRAVSMRWTQKVHFSITPWPRTVTSGLSIMPSRPGQFCGRSRSS